MMNIEMVVLDERVRKLGLPTRATPGSAGMDLFAMIDCSIRPEETVMIPTGLAIWIKNPMYAGFIMARSGLAFKRGLAPANKVGLIDSDYQGPLMVALHNHGLKAQWVIHGERIAQLVVVPIVHFNLIEVSEFVDFTARGEGGFGSTG